MFRAIDEGNAVLNIPAYNGGLFALDPALDALQVPDEVCAHFKDLGDYDNRSAREVADAAEGTAIQRRRGRKGPLRSAGLHALRDEYTRTVAAARALANGILTLERTLSDLVNQACGLTPAEINLLWQTVPPRMPLSPPG